ncbi:MAG TPA: cysteine desulfurase [Candidatus Saccharimonadales bacterium]|nr:cysteine desulfurase [Candidatus Saccharimonadales bacterium]
MKQDFPLFKNNPDLVYLDSAATSQKPQVVIDAVSGFYSNYNSNIHRGIYDLSQKTTDMFEEVRKKVLTFINAKDSSEIIFTSGTTEAINYVAFGWAKKFLKKGDVIILTEMEHHSNIVPWQRLKEEIGVELFFLSIDQDFRLDYKKIEDLDSSKIKLLTLTHASNALGVVNQLEEIIPYFRKLNPKIKVLVDAAQSIPHMSIDVQKMDCDFLAFSSHKMLGPSGVGVLYGKKELLEQMNPLIIGSHMIQSVTKENVTWAELPDKFEPGTRNLEGVIGLGAAIDYLQTVSWYNIQKHELELIQYALDMFASQKNVKLFGPRNAKNRIGVFSFAIGNVHPHDVSEILNRSHIAVRAGHHCAQPLMECLGVTGTVRGSVYLYNTKEDIDVLKKGIEEVKKVFKI